MQHDDRIYLRHMLDMSRKARALASGKSIDCLTGEVATPLSRAEAAMRS